jgi:hypothetical protein
VVEVVALAGWLAWGGTLHWHDLLVLDTDALVPMVFVVERRDGVVVVDPPDGIFEL